MSSLLPVPSVQFVFNAVCKRHNYARRVVPPNRLGRALRKSPRPAAIAFDVRSRVSHTNGTHTHTKTWTRRSASWIFSNRYLGLDLSKNNYSLILSIRVNM